MAENKTKETKASVPAFLKTIADESRRKDCQALVKMMKAVTKLPPKMWGTSIVGFGSYHYRYASGHEGDCCIVGFSPRKQNLTIYILPGFKRFAPLMKKLGKHKTSVSCLYIKRLSDIDSGVLEELVRKSVAAMKRLPGRAS